MLVLLLSDGRFAVDPTPFAATALVVATERKHD